MTLEPQDVLQKLPKNTPLWAVGIVCVLVSSAVCLGGFFVIARPEVQTYIAESFKLQGTRAGVEKDTTNKLFELVTTNTNQITALSIALSNAQENNFKLTERVANIEKEQAVTKAQLEECEKSLNAKK